MYFLIFGDQSNESFEALRSLKCPKDSHVQDFLSKADAAIRRQISLLSRHEREGLPQKFSLLHFVHDWAEPWTTHPVLRPVLTATSQVVELLRYVCPFQAKEGR